MHGVAREDGEERVVDRELNEPGDVLPACSVTLVADRAVQALRYVRPSEGAASARVRFASSRKRLRGGPQSRLVERFVHGSPRLGHRQPLVVRQLEDSFEKALHRRRRPGLGTSRARLTPRLDGESIGASWEG